MSQDRDPRKHQDEPLPPDVLHALRQLHEPPPTPREEMWRQIEARRRRGRIVAGDFRTRRLVRVALAAAAVLALGFLLGRLWERGPDDSPGEVPVASSPAAPEGDDRAAPALSRAQLLHAANHFSRSGVLLAQFAESADSDDPLDPQLHQWAADLLTNTRLLLDSSLAKDPQYLKLLRDLEFTLAAIVQASAAEDETEERRWVAGQVGEGSLVERLQLVVPVLPGARDI